MATASTLTGTTTSTLVRPPFCAQALEGFQGVLAASSIVRLNGSPAVTLTGANATSGVLQYQVAMNNATNQGADLLVAAYSSLGILIGWQVINRANSFAANATYNGSFNFAAAGINQVDTSGITLRVWQGTAGSGYGSGSNTAPAITYRSATSLANGASSGFRVNTTAAPTANSGAMTLAGTVTAGGAQASFPNVRVDTLPSTTTATITAINDNVGVYQGVVANGGRTDDTQVSLSGSLSAALATGEALRIYAGNTLLGTAVVTGTNWTFNDTRTHTNNTALSYTARVVDANGNLGSASAAYTATVDTAAPNRTASILSIADNFGAQTGTVARNGSTDDQTPTLTGTYSGNLAAGDAVLIFNGSTLLGTATMPEMW